MDAIHACRELENAAGENVRHGETSRAGSLGSDQLVEAIPREQGALHSYREFRHPRERAQVAEVRIARMHGKVRRQGRYVGRKPDWKKAYVRLAPGQKQIEFFEGV